MIANYGYEDGSGFYYITVYGDVCAHCEDHPCVTACPSGVYTVEKDDYGDFAAVVAENARKRLREACSGCKARNGGGAVSAGELPCVAACPGNALRHSW